MRIAVVGTFHFCGESIFFPSLFWNDSPLVLQYKIAAQWPPLPIDSFVKENASFFAAQVLEDKSD